MMLTVSVNAAAAEATQETDAKTLDHPRPAEKDVTDNSKKETLYSPCDRTHDTYEYEATWYDYTHAYVNTWFCEPSIWFDDFFGTDRNIEEVAGTYIRWRNDFIFDEEEGFEFDTSLKFSIELPKISRRLKLTFEGDVDEELRDVVPGAQRGDPSNSLGLRYDFFRSPRSSFKINVSLKPRIRLRYRYTYPVTDSFLWRFTQEVQNEESIYGARTRLDLEKAFLPRFLLRATTEGFVAEDFDGVDWLQTLILAQRISKKASISYESSVNGITKPETLTTNYRLGVRFRRNIHRDWLFFEIAPALSWPVDLSDDRQTVVKDRRQIASIVFRLEVHFGNIKKKKYSDYTNLFNLNQNNTRNL